MSVSPGDSDTAVDDTVESIRDLARAATSRGDWAEAHRLWEEVRASDPDHVPAYLGAATALQRLDRPDAADEILGAAATRFPRYERVVVAHARSATLRRDWPAASERWMEVRKRFPDEATAYLLQAQALREQGRTAEMLPVLEPAFERFADNEAVGLAYGRALLAIQNWSGAAAVWEQLRLRFPDNPWSYLGSIKALQGLGQADMVAELTTKALAAAERAERDDSESPPDRRLELELAELRCDWEETRQMAIELIAQGATDTAVHLALAKASWHLRRLDEADEAASEALARNPNTVPALLIRSWVAGERGEAEQSLVFVRRLAELQPNTLAWSIKLAQLLDVLGHFDQAMEELQKIRQRWSDNPIAIRLLSSYGLEAHIEHSDAAVDDEFGALQAGSHPRLRPLADDDLEKDVQFFAVPDATTALLIFTGGRNGFSMPIPVLDRYISTFPAAAIYLKDLNRFRFLAGIRSLGQDLDETVEALREMLSRHGIQRTRTIGNCLGGFAAVRYGIALGADRIVAFSAPTYAPDAPETRLTQLKSFARNRALNRFGHEGLDLKGWLDRHGEGRQIDLFYDEDEALDRDYAQHVESCPGVRLHWRQRANKDVQLCRAIAETEDFRALLSGCLDLN